jgi:ferrous iron transport protein A
LAHPFSEARARRACSLAVNLNAVFNKATFPSMNRLSEIRRGATATVAAIDGTRSFRRRLLEMGLVPGTQVKVVNVAPLGDPLFIEVRGSQWSLRHNEAAEIRIEAASAAAPERSS